MQSLRLTHSRLLLALAFFVPQHLIAQERPADVAHRNDCRLAHQVLVHGQPANKYDWALGVIDDCGAVGADAMAHEFRDLRTLNERTPSLELLMQAALLLVDAELFRAAGEIAADQAAGEIARIQAISLLTLQVTHMVLPYEALVSDPRQGGRLILGPITSRGPGTLRELPAGACESARLLLVSLAESDPKPAIRLAGRQAHAVVYAHCCGATGVLP